MILIQEEVFDLEIPVEELQARIDKGEEVHIDFVVPIRAKAKGEGSQRLGIFKGWKPQKRQVHVYCASLSRHFDLEIQYIKKAWVGHPGDYWKTKIIFPEPPKPKKKGKKAGSDKKGHKSSQKSGEDCRADECCDTRSEQEGPDPGSCSCNKEDL